MFKICIPWGKSDQIRFEYMWVNSVVNPGLLLIPECDYNGVKRVKYVLLSYEGYDCGYKWHWGTIEDTHWAPRDRSARWAYLVRICSEVRGYSLLWPNAITHEKPERGFFAAWGHHINLWPQTTTPIWKVTESGNPWSRYSCVRPVTLCPYVANGLGFGILTHSLWLRTIMLNWAHSQRG